MTRELERFFFFKFEFIRIAVQVGITQRIQRKILIPLFSSSQRYVKSRQILCEVPRGLQIKLKPFVMQENTL